MDIGISRKQVKWGSDFAAARYNIITKLNKDDQAETDERENMGKLWNMSPRSAQRPTIPPQISIRTTSYHLRKVVSTNTSMKLAYTDEALYRILTSKLPDIFKATKDVLHLQPLTVDEKLKHLREIEMENKGDIDDEALAAYHRNKGRAGH
ncbi:hypothetical protein BJ878DRAFT_542174 [Calycina marina]|uniref:Uncharacterized protein n=1 Tax=Calycina marina TaxID=1763456 RepID=A0A9P7Z441_9HELO|nr:hypothetical protein BJ878DRAFT_542174 [Calycina marina]